MWIKDKEGEQRKCMHSLQRQPLFLKVNRVSEHSQPEVFRIYFAIHWMQTGVRVFCGRFSLKINSSDCTAFSQTLTYYLDGDTLWFNKSVNLWRSRLCTDGVLFSSKCPELMDIHGHTTCRSLLTKDWNEIKLYPFFFLNSH